MIQIAYIPGVTNRSSPSTPAHLIPPVPPLPYSDSPVGSQFPGSPNIDIQFAAHDILRGSMCTVDNRSSIATTIYGGNAIVSQPNIIRAGKAAVVTVKGGSSAGTSTNGSPQTENIPPVPSIMYTPRSNNLGDVPPSPAFSVGSTFINRLNSRKGSITTISDQPQQRITQAGTHVIHENNSSSSLNYDSDDGASLMPGHSAKPQSDCSSCITDLGVGSPFSDDNENSMMIDIGAPHGTGVGITRKLSMTASGGKSNNGPRLISLKKPREPKRTISPFDDSHSVDKGR